MRLRATDILQEETITCLFKILSIVCDILATWQAFLSISSYSSDNVNNVIQFKFGDPTNDC